MEVAGNVQIFQYSEKNKAMYISYLAEVDCKAFNCVEEMRPHEEPVLMTKLEFSGHFQNHVDKRV